MSARILIVDDEANIRRMLGALLRAESLTPRKTAGVVIASVGVAVALLTNLGAAPVGA